MTEITIIILTMIILIGAVLIEELRTHSKNSKKNNPISKPLSKPSGGRSPESSSS